jgi:acyl dehydratase
VDSIPRQGYSFIAKVVYADQPVPPQAPRPEELSHGATPRTTDVVRAEGSASFFRTAILSRWFTAAVVVLVIASMLFGAALVLYAHR